MRLRVLIALAALALLVLAPEALGQEHGGAAEGGASAEGGGSAESGSAESGGSAAGGHAEDEGGSFLVSPGLGLMIWTLILFGFTMWFLSRTAFPRIGEALEKRANAIRENIEASEKQREEADELLKEYRHRLTEAREQADDIVARARKAAEAAVAEAASEGKAKREELVAAARKDIETETRRSLEQIRKEVADLTVLATEKVTRMSLDDDDHKRLIDDALKEVDFSALAGAEQNGENP
jgi:F-type H+-transporting ATPase subunit b